MLIELPTEFIAKTAYSEQEFKEDVAVVLYQREVLTLARAAKWVGKTRLQFQKILADHNVPINFSIDDFSIDLKTIQSMSI